MNAKEIKFLDLFDGKVQYLVPRWQRRYRWGEPEIRRLLDDMLAIADAEDQARPHYGGIVITVREGTGAMKVHRVVDGQQRLTTVSMLLARIEEILDSDGKCGELTAEVIRLDLLTNPNRQEKELRKLRLQDGDEEEYRRIIERDDPGSGNGAVAKAWRYLRRNVSSANVESLINGLHRLHVITVGLEDRDDAQQIFESLNATGRPLTEGEKVKNWLLMGLPEETQNALNDEHWLNIEKALDARRHANRIDMFPARHDSVAHRQTGSYCGYLRRVPQVGNSGGTRQRQRASRTMQRARAPRPSLREAYRNHGPTLGQEDRGLAPAPEGDGHRRSPTLHSSPALGSESRRWREFNR
ncbi:MAG: DUF262 domain-containing protein [Caldilineaceae bacterium]|nr:DUF262 domain-containing protein [Caldilineaceae bacterium]